jgi:hypothetical protein
LCRQTFGTFSHQRCLATTDKQLKNFIGQICKAVVQNTANLCAKLKIVAIKHSTNHPGQYWIKPRIRESSRRQNKSLFVRQKVPINRERLQRSQTANNKGAGEELQQAQISKPEAATTSRREKIRFQRNPKRASQSAADHRRDSREVRAFGSIAEQYLLCVLHSPVVMIGTRRRPLSD